jgi:hypothetical protein
MAPIPDNAAVLGIGQQGAKGSPAAPSVVLGYTGTPSLAPGVQLVTLAETDSSAQAGIDVVVGTQPGGNAEHYLRPSSFSLVAFALMGGGSTATATPSATQDYFTLVEDWNLGTMVVQYEDAKCTELVVTAQNGQVVTYTSTWQALSYTFGGGSIGPITELETPLAWPSVQVIRNGTHPGTANTCTLTINRNATRVPGDQGFANIDVVPGLFNVTGEMQVLFEDDQAMRSFATGSPTGTVATPTLYSESLTLDIHDTTGRGCSFDMAAIQFTNVTTAVGTNASPAFMTMQFKTQRQANIADNLTITTTA